MPRAKAEKPAPAKTAPLPADMTEQELREMLLVHIYKTALVRSQVEAICEILIKRKVTTYEEIWKRTQEIYQDSKL
ncbi:MAG: hypothetical protein ABIH41_02525 [Nanoarchaeota archaeon]